MGMRLLEAFSCPHAPGSHVSEGLCPWNWLQNPVDVYCLLFFFLSSFTLLQCPHDYPGPSHWGALAHIYSPVSLLETIIWMSHRLVPFPLKESSLRTGGSYLFFLKNYSKIAEMGGSGGQPHFCCPVCPRCLALSGISVPQASVNKDHGIHSLHLLPAHRVADTVLGAGCLFVYLGFATSTEIATYRQMLRDWENFLSCFQMKLRLSNANVASYRYQPMALNFI